MLCGRESNRRCGVELTMHHRLCDSLYLPTCSKLRLHSSKGCNTLSPLENDLSSMCYMVFHEILRCALVGCTCICSWDVSRHEAYWVATAPRSTAASQRYSLPSSEHLQLLIAQQAHLSLSLITDRINAASNAIASVRLSVHLFPLLTSEPTGVDLNFCTWVGHFSVNFSLCIVVLLHACHCSPFILSLLFVQCGHVVKSFLSSFLFPLCFSGYFVASSWLFGFLMSVFMFATRNGE